MRRFVSSAQAKKNPEYQCGQHPQSGGARGSPARTAFVGATDHGLAFRIASAGCNKINIFQIMRLDPLATTAHPRQVTPSGSSHASNQAVPDANGASALEQDHCATHGGAFPGHAMRPKPNAAASAGLTVRSCSATSSWSISCPRPKPGPRAAPANKLRRGAAPKGCDVRPVMRRDVAKSLNRDHRALHPVLAHDLCGRRPISINLSTSQLNENVSWIDWRTMEPLLRRSNIGGRLEKAAVATGGKPQGDFKMSTFSDSHVSRLLFATPALDRVVGLTARRWRRLACPAVRAISARAALHAWPRPKMAREARVGRKLK